MTWETKSKELKGKYRNKLNKTNENIDINDIKGMCTNKNSAYFSTEIKEIDRAFEDCYMKIPCGKCSHLRDDDDVN